MIINIGLATPDTVQRRAIGLGLAAAQVNLGLMYANGRGVPQDYVQAHLWLNLAAAGSPEKAETRKGAAENRDIVAAKMAPQQIAEAQRLAREWKPKQGGSVHP